MGTGELGSCSALPLLTTSSRPGRQTPLHPFWSLAFQHGIALYSGQETRFFLVGRCCDRGNGGIYVCWKGCVRVSMSGWLVSGGQGMGDGVKGGVKGEGPVGIYGQDVIRTPGSRGRKAVSGVL